MGGDTEGGEKKRGIKKRGIKRGQRWIGGGD